MQLRKEHAIIQDGTIRFLYPEEPRVLAYVRELDGQELIVLNNLTGDEVALQEPVHCMRAQCLISNYVQDELIDSVETLRPYESVVLRK